MAGRPRRDERGGPQLRPALSRQGARVSRDAQDSLDLERPTAAAGNAIHAGISAKDAILTALSGRTGKSKNHARAAAELRASLAGRPDAAAAERALRELIAWKGDVEYGTKAPTLVQANPLVRRARTLVEMAEEIVGA